MNKRYAFLLDFFPLVDDITYENHVLGERLQSIGLAVLLHEEDPAQLVLLLHLARDLGYLDPKIVAFLEEELMQVIRSSQHQKRYAPSRDRHR